MLQRIWNNLELIRKNLFCSTEYIIPEAVKRSNVYVYVLGGLAVTV